MTLKIIDGKKIAGIIKKEASKELFIRSIS